MASDPTPVTVTEETLSVPVGAHHYGMLGFNLWIELKVEKRTLRTERFAVGGRELLLRRLEPGTFAMGAAEGDVRARSDERPRHEVTLGRAFSLGVYPVTQGLYAQLMGDNPAKLGQGDNHPVDGVSWFDGIRFCNALSRACGLPEVYRIREVNDTEYLADLNAPGFRLPTEAEWEFAAAAGVDTQYAGSDNPDDVAWWRDEATGATRAVGTKWPNGWGIYDLSGNVAEWCWDLYATTYPSAPQVDPEGPVRGIYRVCRGGHCADAAESVRVRSRNWNVPGFRRGPLGLRVARTWL